jgi:tetratricopeptide (TPR) repeat protein
MGRLTLSLIRRFREWDMPAQVAMLLALVLFVLIIFAAGFGPPDIRQPAVFGIIGLLLVMQGITLWANRDLVTPFTQAQRAYLRADFDGARAILEPLRNENSNERELTLLGNIYRQLGRLDESEAVLREAVGKAPEDHFPLYGLGRTLLAQGDYDGAVQMIRQSLDAGGPYVVRADLGEALYRAGQTDEARKALEAVDTAGQEAYRALMVSYLLYQLGAGESPSWALIVEGLAYWQAAAERFGGTPYGQALAQDLTAIKRLSAA